jgi:hypothetical protein
MQVEGIYSSVGTAVSTFVKNLNLHSVRFQWNDDFILALKDCHSNSGSVEVFSMEIMKTCVSNI